MERGPRCRPSTSTSDYFEFQMIIEKWADLEDRMRKKWEYIEYQEHNSWFQILLGIWLVASLMMNRSSNRIRIFETWSDMCQIIGRKRVNENQHDNEILDKIIKKLKHKALNKLIKDWDADVEDYWKDIVRMKMEKNMEWCKPLREKCNTWIRYHSS
ncbi:hypothetical protein C922_05066 [Plasmodium inui San Antonio 1]|uniref:Plasmodium RESA N-terminal domain-containing protein n=1 Tax=Plasmodium inui San Antonio 1 TaxID=1237626 RepID=W6ZZ57_9APIC|nr:hypothetical protein C922_05066 [Plasmodium inui San Antonio 1]EUD64550.1 hypothetical protein C922_05066 [Plasmodium inui San Antonio 1]